MWGWLVLLNRFDLLLFVVVSISKTVGLLGGMPDICPVMDIEADGSAVKEKARGKESNCHVVEIYDSNCRAGAVLTHVKCLSLTLNVPSDAQAVKELTKKSFHRPVISPSLPLAQLLVFILVLELLQHSGGENLALKMLFE